MSLPEKTRSIEYIRTSHFHVILDYKNDCTDNNSTDICVFMGKWDI